MRRLGVSWTLRWEICTETDVGERCIREHGLEGRVEIVLLWSVDVWWFLEGVGSGTLYRWGKRDGNVGLLAFVRWRLTDVEMSSTSSHEPTGADRSRPQG